MRPHVYVALAAMGWSLSLAAQGSCAPHALDGSIRAVTAARHALQLDPVAAQDAQISPARANQLAALKLALSATAQTALACSGPAVSQAELQALLAEALHANLPQEEPVRELADGRETGIYGSNLAVQVFQLFDTPKIYEVDFRYGIACGDDHLLLVFRAAGDDAPYGWKQLLRWDAHGYNTVGDALGDFVLLTPLTGNARHPDWRFLVAHGHPGCATTPRPSRFDLDLLTPSPNPEAPTVSWHFSGAYTEGTVVPHLATTEDTVEFRLAPPASTGGGSAAGSEAVYRFHLDAHGDLVPTTDAIAGSPPSPSGPGSAVPASTSSPQ